MKYSINLLQWSLATAVALIGAALLKNIGSDALLLYSAGVEVNAASALLSLVLLFLAFLVGGAMSLVGKLSKRLYQPLDQFVH